MNEPTPLEGILISAEADIGGGLVAVQTRPTLDIFTAPGLPDAILAAVRAAAFDGFTPDTTTDKGRKAIASQAYRVTRTKTYLDDLGKTEVARLKELPRAVDAGRKLLRDGLDQLAAEVRRDLTDWEEDRKREQAFLARIREYPVGTIKAHDSATVQALINELEALTIDPHSPIAAEAMQAKKDALGAMMDSLRVKVKAEADAAELEALRKAEAERKEEERREALRREGEERARQQAAQQPPTKALPQAVEPPTLPSAAPEPESLPWDEPAAPAPERVQAATAQAGDIEHRRAFNREALEDIRNAILGVASIELDEISKAVLGAIVRGRVRHIAITY